MLERKLNHQMIGNFLGNDIDMSDIRENDPYKAKKLNRRATIIRQMRVDAYSNRGLTNA